ncbi:SLC13 family permease [Elusimicrobiota bacterium]
MKIIVLLLFVLTYTLIVLKRDKSLRILLGSIAVLFISGIMSPAQIWESMNLNVLGIFLGTMIISGLFIYSGVPAYITDLIVRHTKRADIAFLSICVFASFISSFTENIATVMIVAPLALELARRLKINPALLLIGISVSSNLQGTATLIGDAPSILLATKANMTFNDFFFMQGKLGIFFAVQVGALGSFIVLYLMYKKFAVKLPKIESMAQVKSWVPTILTGCMVLNLILLSVIKVRVPYALAIVCMFWAAVGLIWHEFAHKESISIVKDLDWYSLAFLAGIFIVIGSLNVSGLIDDLANILIGFSGGSVLNAYIMIIVISVFVSAFVDNIPYTIAMMPLAIKIAESFNVSIYLFLFGLLIATCLGGNITPFGSASNIVTMGLLKKNGYPVKLTEFVKLGFPFTITAVSLGSIFVWMVWR